MFCFIFDGIIILGLIGKFVLIIMVGVVSFECLVIVECLKEGIVVVCVWG